MSVASLLMPSMLVTFNVSVVSGSVSLLNKSPAIAEELLIFLAACAAKEMEDTFDRPNLVDLPWPIIERWAQLMERGAEKYGERNWELGQPLMSFYDSGLRHYMQWYQGTNTEEDHLAAVFYNIGGLIDTAQMIEDGYLPKSLDDRPSVQEATDG